jgi:dTDP-4-dehydrorhamnose reductase
LRLLVFGFGYTARAAFKRLRPRLAAAWGTTREAEKLAHIAALGVSPILFGAAGSSPAKRGRGTARRAVEGAGLAPTLDDLPPPPRSAWSPSPVASDGGGTDATADAPSAVLSRADHILASIPPSESGDPILTRFHDALASAKPRSIVYLSTVGVYGDHTGAWVDETSECRPVSKRSVERLQAETAWRRFSDETGVPVAILRLAGIYGPGRSPFEKIRSGTARRIVKPAQVFNRIHVDDIAAAVEAAFDRRAGGIFNVVDDEPAPPQDVLAYAAHLLDLPPPPEIPFEHADLSPMARSFYGENKRVRNDKLKHDLGVRLAYPTYREGLRALLRPGDFS